MRGENNCGVDLDKNGSSNIGNFPAKPSPTKGNKTCLISLTKCPLLSDHQNNKRWGAAQEETGMMRTRSPICPADGRLQFGQFTLLHGVKWLLSYNN
ncbi:hypothetical protein MLD38_003845 [Melastoma candidum]|uniref:Uncharacterized protein n=1 Tax=Melastoma candidum TaxID=119954 RepID=A0ACB9S3V9_9MYRT|nr:hypothetical protein MLD38_003845 [Melastoma candidum]